MAQLTSQPPATTTVAIILGIVFIGFMQFIRIAQREHRRNTPWRLKTFFLGGAQIGPELTEHNTLGITFAWAGGTWFFVTLAYSYGPWVVLMQLPWCFSIWLLSRLYRRILPATKNRTLHGYLGERYGKRTQRVAGTATSFGYIINAGFETFWASLMLTSFLGRPELLVPVAFILGVIAALYCSIGGYASNVATDQPQNLLGVASLAVVCSFVCWELPVGTPLRVASVVFAAGSLIYVAINAWQWKSPSALRGRVEQFVAWAFAVVACLCAVLLSIVHPSDASVSATTLGSSMLPWDLLVGLLGFQLFFNAVDMANWQQVAANGDVPAERQSAVAESILRGALYLTWFPALGGTLIGCALRSLSTTLDGNQIFSQAFAQVLPAGPELLQAIVLGVLVLGFLSTSLSTVDSMLMSAAQTVAYDVVWIDLQQRAVGNERLEAKVIYRARMLLVPLGMSAVAVFWLLYQSYAGDALNFQAMMYAFALSLFTPAMLALWKPSVTKKAGGAAFIGVLLALVAVFLMFRFAVSLDPAEKLRSWLLNLMPLVANAITLLALLPSFFRRSDATLQVPNT